MTEDPEQDLLRRCQAPDPATREAAFEILYRRHADRVYRLALRLTGQDSEARDIVQEAFLRVFRRVSRFRREAALSSWLHRITVNIAIDRHRAARRRPAAPLEGDRALVRPLPGRPEPSGPGARAEQGELAGSVRDLIASLSPPLAEVVVLRYGEGLSYEEIAEALGIALGTVKSRLSRAHELLEPQLRSLRDAGA